MLSLCQFPGESFRVLLRLWLVLQEDSGGNYSSGSEQEPKKVREHTYLGAVPRHRLKSDWLPVVL